MGVLNSTNSIKVNRFKPIPTVRFTLLIVFGALVFTYFAAFKRLLEIHDAYRPILILCLGIYMVWHERRQLQTLSIHQSPWIGGMLLFIGGLLLLAGQLSNTLVIIDLALITAIIGTLWLVLGKGYISVLGLPILFLFCMLPFTEVVLSIFSLRFQLVTAEIATALLNLTGSPVLHDQKLIQLPHITLEVGESCSGIHHISALMALSVPFAFFTQKSWPRKLLFIFCAFWLGILLNGFRVALIGVWTKYNGGEFSHGPFNLFYASFVLFIGLALLFLIGFITRKKTRFSPTESDSIRQPEKKLNHPASPAKFYKSVTIAMVILMTTAIFSYAYHIRPVPLKFSLATFPYKIGNWEGYDVDNEKWPLSHLGGDEQIRRIYSNNSGAELGLYIGYYTKQEQGSELVSILLNWLHTNTRSINIESPGNQIEILQSNDHFEKGRLTDFYFWYQIDGRHMTNRQKVKVETLKNALFHQKTNGAMIIVAEESNFQSRTNFPDPAIDFIRLAMPIIDSQLEPAQGY